MEGEKINHPAHYGGDVQYEAIKLIDDWHLGFSVGNALKYILRAPHKGTQLEDLKKAQWYMHHATWIRERRRHLSWRTRLLIWWDPTKVFKLDALKAAHYHQTSVRIQNALVAIQYMELTDAYNFITAEILFRESLV
jgi:hypothetical protein